jgi:DNA-binding transcriptional LysR family regulator
VSLSDTLYPGRRDLMRRMGDEAGFQPNIVCEVDTLSLMLGAIATGDGVGILPQHTQKLPHTGCVFVKLASPVPYTDLYLLLPRGDTSREMATLISLIQEHAARLTK